MTEPKHTPGPWKAESQLHPWIGAKDGNVWWKIHAGESDYIADTGRTDSPTKADIERDAANAHLIAAAPELYDVLVSLRPDEKFVYSVDGVMQYCDFCGWQRVYDEDDQINYCPTQKCAVVRAALAKARGEGAKP